MGDSCVQVSALKVDDNSGLRRQILYEVQREGRVTIWALKAGVARVRSDDLRKTHIPIESGAMLNVCCRNCHLVEVHWTAFCGLTPELSRAAEWRRMGLSVAPKAQTSHEAASA